MTARGTSAFISYGGLGDFILHVDAIRQYFSRRTFRPDLLLASSSLCSLGELLLPGSRWTPLDGYGADGLATFEHAVVLRWFTEVRTDAPEVRSALIEDASRYRTFDQARSTGATALHDLFKAGLTMRAIVCRSWGFDEDQSFAELRPEALEPVLPAGAKFVVVSNGADRPWPVRTRQTKQLPRGTFERCVAAIGESLADHAIVEVGTDPADAPMSGVRDLRGRTTLTELISLLARADAIVCVEGGIAHLAAALRRPALVLSGPTSSTNFGHGLHTYLSSGICSPCAWSTLDWYAVCPLQINAVCTAAIRPHAVVEGLHDILGSERSDFR